MKSPIFILTILTTKYEYIDVEYLDIEEARENAKYWLINKTAIAAFINRK